MKVPFLDLKAVNAPYEISFLMNNQTSDLLNNGIDSLEIAIGYLKYNLNVHLLHIYYTFFLLLDIK